MLLRPSGKATLARLAARAPAEGSFKGVLAQAIALIHADMNRHPKAGWQVVNSSELSVEETVDLILVLTGTVSD